MAADDKEIEIKIPLSKRDFDRIKKEVGKVCKFVGVSQQKDEYFVPIHRDFVEPQFPFEWLSIRNRGDQAILTYKHYYPENTDITNYCDQFETVVESPDKLKKILNSLDFKPLTIVEKVREVYEYKDEFEIALDRVKNLGYFIEIEAMQDFGGYQRTRTKIMEFAKELGLEKFKREKRGYPYMMLKKQGLV